MRNFITLAVAAGSATAFANAQVSMPSYIPYPNTTIATSSSLLTAPSSSLAFSAVDSTADASPISSQAVISQATPQAAPTITSDVTSQASSPGSPLITRDPVLIPIINNPSPSSTSTGWTTTITITSTTYITLSWYHESTVTPSIVTKTTSFYTTTTLPVTPPHPAIPAHPAIPQPPVISKNPFLPSAPYPTPKNGSVYAPSGSAPTLPFVSVPTGGFVLQPSSVSAQGLPVPAYAALNTSSALPYGPMAIPVEDHSTPTAEVITATATTRVTAYTLPASLITSMVMPSDSSTPRPAVGQIAAWDAGKGAVRDVGSVSGTVRVRGCGVVRWGLVVVAVFVGGMMG